MNQTLINASGTTSPMACLLDRFPQALKWGLPNFLRDSGSEDSDWRAAATRGDYSARVVLKALQEAYAIAGKPNQADLSTKHVERAIIDKVWASCNIKLMGGTSKQALRAAV